MAYTHTDQVSESPTGEGSSPPTPNYYYEDLMIVYQQSGAVSFGELPVQFRNEEITVIAAFDSNGDALRKIALPCPPYHEPTNPEAAPGKYLAANITQTQN